MQDEQLNVSSVNLCDVVRSSQQLVEAKNGKSSITGHGHPDIIQTATCTMPNVLCSGTHLHVQVARLHLSNACATRVDSLQVQAVGIYAVCVFHSC